MSSIPNASDQPFITFNTWTNGRNVGHCSYNYGEKDSEGTVIWEKYHSIQPSWGIPTPLFPIPGRAICDLETDCNLEGSRMPDRYTFPITHRQLNSIDTHTEQSRQDISSYEKLYTYLPNCPLNGRVMSSFAHLSFDDVPEASEAASRKAYTHCVNEAREAQQIIGLPVSTPKPWYVSTPVAFKREIEERALHTPGAEIVLSNYVPTIEDKMNELPPF